MKCPSCGADLMHIDNGRYECRNDSCDVIEVRTRTRPGRRQGMRILREPRLKT